MTKPTTQRLPHEHPWRPSWSWGDRVRKVRRNLGLTQSEFADLTGFGMKAIAAWEVGTNTPDIPAVAVRLEETTLVDRYWWLGWEAPPSPADSVPGAVLDFEEDLECTARDSNPEPADYELAA